MAIFDAGSQADLLAGGAFSRADLGAIDALEPLPQIDLLAELMGGDSLLPASFEFDYLQADRA